MPLLEIKKLHVEIDGKKILNGLDLMIEKGKVHAIMGPNGSGKSTLSYVLASKPEYEVTKGSVRFEGEDLLALEPDERAVRSARSAARPSPWSRHGSFSHERRHAHR